MPVNLLIFQHLFREKELSIDLITVDKKIKI